MKDVVFSLLDGRHQRANKVTDLFNWAPRNGRFGLPTFSSNFLRQQPCTRIADVITQDEFA